MKLIIEYDPWKERLLAVSAAKRMEAIGIHAHLVEKSPLPPRDKAILPWEAVVEAFKPKPQTLTDKVDMVMEQLGGRK